MNVIGEIGNFIIKYQEPLQAGAILAMIIAAVIIIVKLFINAKKKREILSEINHTVSEINTAVNHLNEKKADVIYIDSRVTQGTDKAAKEEAKTPTTLSDAEPEAETGETSEAKADGETAVEEIVEKIEPSLKYFSRDCAVSKTGKQYTFEELDAQIKD